jgi:hypothetical protein
MQGREAHHAAEARRRRSRGTGAVGRSLYRVMGGGSGGASEARGGLPASSSRKRPRPARSGASGAPRVPVPAHCTRLPRAVSGAKESPVNLPRLERPVGRNARGRAHPSRIPHVVLGPHDVLRETPRQDPNGLPGQVRSPRVVVGSGHIDRATPAPLGPRVSSAAKPIRSSSGSEFRSEAGSLAHARRRRAASVTIRHRASLAAAG